MPYENPGIGPPVSHFRTTPVGGMVAGTIPSPRRNLTPHARTNRTRLPRQAPTSGSGDLAIAGLTMSLVLAVSILFLLFKYVVLALAVAGVAFFLHGMPKGRWKGHASVRAARPGRVGIGIGSALGACVGGVGSMVACLGTAFMEGVASGFKAAAWALLAVMTAAYRIVAAAFSILMSILFLSFLFNLFGGRDK